MIRPDPLPLALFDAISKGVPEEGAKRLIFQDCFDSGQSYPHLFHLILHGNWG